MRPYREQWSFFKKVSLPVALAILISCSQEGVKDGSNDPKGLTVYLTANEPVAEYKYEPEELVGELASPDQLTPPQPYPNPDPTLESDIYKWFFNYRLEKFSPKNEPLLKERLGDALGIKKASIWEYPSYNSFAVGFATSLPTIAVVEYGETTAYGSKSAVSESYFYNHLFTLKGLGEGVIYHYRIIAQDEDGKAIALPDKTFTTKTFTDEVKLYQADFVHQNPDYPGNSAGLWITNPGVYVLTEDIVSDGLGITIRAHDVTIDLNGHTLIYDNGVNTSDSPSQYNQSASYGITAGLWSFKNAKIFNGTIKQGKTGTSRAPLFLHDMGITKNEIAGLTLDYYAFQPPGIQTSAGYIHHNLIYDRGGDMTNRHAGVRALEARNNVEVGDNSEVAYNSIRRFRHRGIDNAKYVHDNELYSDSYDTNSFALGAGAGVTLKNNKIFGMGYAPIGIGWGNNLHVADNIIYMWCYSPNQRSDEYGRLSTAAGMRVTNYYTNNPFENMLFEGNTIVLKGVDGCTMMRGVWGSNGVGDKNILYRHNTIKTEAMPGNAQPVNPDFIDYYYNGVVGNAIAPITIQGSSTGLSTDIPNGVVFEDNYLISNVNHIILSDAYGAGNGQRFYRNTLEKIEHDSDHKFFAPVRLGFWFWNTLQNRIIDSKLIGFTEEEEELTPYFYGSTGWMDVSYGERKTFLFLDGGGQPIAAKSVALTMEPIDGIVQHEITDSNGKASFDIFSSMHFKRGDQRDGGVQGTPAKVEYTQYTFTIESYTPYTFDAGALPPEPPR
ncbi:MAG: hypothetical protein LBP51_02525 [Deferribacteraceae bacterium]|nr:hypothetical protein [Deferribacteraceae bacterium]